MINLNSILAASATQHNREIAIEAYERFIQDRIDAEHNRQWSDIAAAQKDYDYWAYSNCNYVANVPGYSKGDVISLVEKTKPLPAQPMRKIAEPKGRLHVLPDQLHAALKKATKFIIAKPALPVLANVLLNEGSDTRLYIAASTIDYIFRTSITAKIEKSEILEPINLTISAKTAADYLALADNELMVLTQYTKPSKGLSLNVAQRTNSANFYAIEADYFPALPASENGTIIGVITQPDQWIAAIKAGYANAAKEDNRPILTGLLIETFAAGHARISATDGYRLSIQNLTLDGYTDYSAIVPAKTLATIAGLLDKSAPVEIVAYQHAGESWFAFRQDSDEYILQTIDGKFPMVEMVIPKNPTLCATADLDHLLKAMKLRQWAREESVKVTFEPNEIVISSISQENSNVETRIPSHTEGQGFTIYFDAHQFQTLLKSLADSLPVEKRKIVSVNAKGKPTSKTVTEPRYIDIAGKNESNPIQITAGNTLMVLMPGKADR